MSENMPKHSDGTTDARYSVAVEYGGHFPTIPGMRAGQVFVTRFCGERIGKGITREDAERVAVQHADARRVRMSSPVSAPVSAPVSGPVSGACARDEHGACTGVATGAGRWAHCQCACHASRVIISEVPA